MAKQRFIHQEFWTDPTIGKLSPTDRLFFIGCFSSADDEGRLLGEPSYLRSVVFPYDDVTISDIRAMRDRVVATCKNLLFYTVDGVDLLAFRHWSRYQNPRYPKPSRFPPPPVDTGTRSAQEFDILSVTTPPSNHAITTSQTNSNHAVTATHPNGNQAATSQQLSGERIAPIWLPCENQMGTNQQPNGNCGLGLGRVGLGRTGTYRACADEDCAGTVNNERLVTTLSGESLAVEMATGTGSPPVDLSTTRDRVQSFMEFWEAYPRKAGKRAAEEAWRKLKPNEALLVEILSAIETAKRSRQWQRDDGQYIPNPVTWLNQRRWEDETPAPAPSKSFSGLSHRQQTPRDSSGKYDEADIILRRIRQRDGEERATGMYEEGGFVNSS